MIELPFDAEYMPAKTKRFKETIVFVHHFGGSRRTVLRHLKLVNDMGFDAVRFDLVFNGFDLKQPVPITSSLKFGVINLWVDQVESILNALPGRKIMYTFSMPSLGALGALAHRKAYDVQAWIADGGPFLQLFRCTMNLLEHQYGVENPLLRAAYAAASYPLFGTGVDFVVPSWCGSLPKNFPTLSIRGEQDPLVPVSAIEDVFKHAPQIDLERLALPEGHHLDGLKKFPAIYDPAVRAFLTKTATLV